MKENGPTRKEEQLHYNAENKRKFIERFNNDETIRVTTSLFRQIAHSEYLLNKDISEMTMDELKDSIKKLNSTSLPSLIDKVSKIEQYIEFTGVKVNNAKFLDDRQILETLLTDDIEKGETIFGREEVDYVIAELYNDQDKATIQFLYELGGKKDSFNAIINLKISDIDFTNKTILIEDKNYGSKSYPASLKLLKLLRNAFNEQEYMSLCSTAKGEYYKKGILASSEYVFRGLRDNFQVHHRTVTTRLIRASDRLGFKYLNATNLQKSGQLLKLHALVQNGEDIDKACAEVLAHYRESSQYHACRRLKQTYFEQVAIIEKKV